MRRGHCWINHIHFHLFIWPHALAIPVLQPPASSISESRHLARRSAAALHMIQIPLWYGCTSVYDCHRATPRFCNAGANCLPRGQPLAPCSFGAACRYDATVDFTASGTFHLWLSFAWQHAIAWLFCDIWCLDRVQQAHQQTFRMDG